MVDRSTYTDASPSVPGATSGQRGFVAQVAEHAAVMWQYLPLDLTITSGVEPDDLTASLAHPLGVGGLQQGMSFWIEPLQANTGPMTISIDGEAAVSITDRLGAGLSAGALASGGRYLLNFDGTAARVVNQIELGSGSTGVVTQIFTANGTSTKPEGFPNNGLIIIEAIGGGQGGGRRASGAGKGGDGGIYAMRFATGADYGATETVTVGQGGLPAGIDANGNPGTDTSIGALLIGYGGGQAQVGLEPARAGGSAANPGQNAFRGGAGGGGGNNAAGGTSQLGGDGGNGVTSGLAENGSAPGGGGGANGNNGTAGNGARGEARITFVWP